MMREHPLEGLAIKESSSVLLRYGVAVATVALTFGVKFLVDPYLLQDTPFLLVFTAIMVSAWYGGLGPGLFGTVLAGLLTDYFFLAPTGSLSGFTMQGLPVGLFLMEGALVSILTSALRGATQRAEASALENARLYAEISARENQLQDLAKRLLAAQEEERRRVAYDVHDGLTQMAVAAYRYLEDFADEYPPDSQMGREALGEIIEVLRRTVGEARRVISDLRPTVLDDFGLVAALRQQVSALRAEPRQVQYDDGLGKERLPPEVETVLYRITQEALNNVKKHAGDGAPVRVSLQRVRNTVRLEVEDKGCGFDQPNVQWSNDGPGERVGLSGMRERAELLGGRVEISSKPGEGTSMVVILPLPGEVNGTEALSLG